MKGNSKNSKRIAKNTLVLYFRMLFLTIVSLYTSRVILDALGVEDYGIYNVVAGFIMMFNMIKTALINANSRFINYEIGRGNSERLSLVFSTAIIVHIGIALIITLIAETVGLWYVNNVMVLPQERIGAANWCYQFSIFNFCMIMINIPYRACIIAHEKMTTFAYVSIVEGVGQLLIAYLVMWSPMDKLIYYALLLFILQNGIRFIYQSYCRKRFSECKFRFVYDRETTKQLLSFSFWNIFGNGASVLKSYGGNLILNLFFGPSVNAARGLSLNVSHAVSNFSTNILVAMTPQITQSYAKRDYTYMFNLINKGTRFSFYLLFIISLPVIVNAEYILQIWLKEVPEYTVIFVRLLMANSLIFVITRPLVTAQNATGNIKAFQIAVGVIELLNLPISYLTLWLGYPPYSVFIVAVALEIVAVFVRIFMLPQTISAFSPASFIKDVIVKCAVLSLLSAVVPYLFTRWFNNGTFLCFLINCAVCVLSTGIVVWVYGISKGERMFITDKIVAIVKRKNR